MDRKTNYLFPPSMDEWLDKAHLARYVVEIVDQLNLETIEMRYSWRGSKAYHPAVLLSLLIYGCATGVFSSRKIERATYDSVAFRYIAAGTHPDHDTIAKFRRRFLPEIKALFVNVLAIASETKVLKMGTIALDGTKIRANASKHHALSYGRMLSLEEQLVLEVSELLELSEKEDTQNLPEGLSIPKELELRETRLNAIRQAKKKLEERAGLRIEKEKIEYEEKVAKRKEQEEKKGKLSKRKPLKEPSADVKEKEQINLTDEESRIMPVSSGGFEQCYNAQAAVDTSTLLVLANTVSQATNDKQQLSSILEKLNAVSISKEAILHLLADCGYYSVKNIEECVQRGFTPLLAMSRENHHPHWMERHKEAVELKDDPTLTQEMSHFLKSKEGRSLYSLRKQTIEPVFGIIKSVLGFRQFLLRGIEKVQGEWSLVCMAWNIKRMATLRK